MKKILDYSEKALFYLACFLFCLFHVLILLQVISRYVFNNSLTWTEQTTRYLFNWMVLLYLPVVLRQRGNMAFDLLVQKLPKKMQELTQVFCEALIGLFGCYWCYWGIKLCIKFSGKIFDGIRIPKTWVYAAQPVSAFFLFLFSAELVINYILKRKRGER